MNENSSTLRKIINRNVERHLVREFLMRNTKKAGFGGLEIKRTPAGTGSNRQGREARNGHWP